MDFVQQRTCEVNLGYSTDVCSHLHDKSHKEEMEKVQIATSHIFMYRTILDKVPAVLFLLILGEF